MTALNLLSTSMRDKVEFESESKLLGEMNWGRWLWAEVKAYMIQQLEQRSPLRSGQVSCRSQIAWMYWYQAQQKPQQVMRAKRWLGSKLISSLAEKSPYRFRIKLGLTFEMMLLRSCSCHWMELKLLMIIVRVRESVSGEYTDTLRRKVLSVGIWILSVLRLDFRSRVCLLSSLNVPYCRLKLKYVRPLSHSVTVSIY